MWQNTAESTGGGETAGPWKGRSSRGPLEEDVAHNVIVAGKAQGKDWDWEEASKPSVCRERKEKKG